MLVLSILLLCYVLLIFFSKKTTASLGHFQIFKWLQVSRCIFESKYIFWVKENFAVLLAFLYDVKLVFCKIYNMLISYFHILQECFEVLKLQYFKLLCMPPFLPMCMQHVPLIVAELLIYCKKYFLIQQNKTY